jgi:hypothetical protein
MIHPARAPNIEPKMEVPPNMESALLSETLGKVIHTTIHMTRMNQGLRIAAKAKRLPTTAEMLT